MYRWKDAPLNMSFGKCKLKKRDTTIPLVEWPKFGTPTTVNFGEDVK